MANLSDLTRKDQVLAYLKARTGLWVDGSELATEVVGGSEGLRRLRELRDEDGYNIQTRVHPDPDRDINQYRIVPGKLKPVGPAMVDESVTATSGPARVTHGDFPHVDFPATLSPPQHRAPVDHVRQRELARKVAVSPPDHSQARMGEAVRRKEDGTFEYVPPQAALIEPDGQLTMDAPEAATLPASRFSALPSKINYGAVAICPRCHGKTTRGRPRKKVEDSSRPTMVQERRRKKSDDGSMPLIDEDGVLLHRDPHSRKAKPCERCNGYGIVPNIGPIAFTAPE